MNWIDLLGDLLSLAFFLLAVTACSYAGSRLALSHDRRKQRAADDTPTPDPAYDRALERMLGRDRRTGGYPAGSKTAAEMKPPPGKTG